MWFRVLSQAAVRDGVELDSVARGFIREGEVVRALDVQSTRTGQQRVKVDRGWISVYTRDGTQLLDRVIPFAGSSAVTSDDTEVDDQQAERALPWEYSDTGESIFPSRSDNFAASESSSSESSSSDDEAPVVTDELPQQALSRRRHRWQHTHSASRGVEQPQHLLEARASQLDVSADPAVAATGAAAADVASTATPPVGVHWHDPRSPWRDHDQDLRVGPRAAVPTESATGGRDQRVADEQDETQSYGLRASPPPTGHYTSGLEPQQRPQTASSHTRDVQLVTTRIRSSSGLEPEPEPEPERALHVEQVEAYGVRLEQPSSGANDDELERMSDDVLVRLHRVLSQKIDNVTAEIDRRRQAAIEDQVRQQVEECVREEQLCKVCVTRPRDTVFIPCGHMFSCNACSMRVEFCPVCRSAISSRQRTFVS